jgi:hypothetical protein
VVVVGPGFFWPPPAGAVGAVVVAGIGDVGDGIETWVGAVVSPLSSEPQPANATSSAAAASTAVDVLRRVRFTSAAFVASPEVPGSPLCPSSKPGKVADRRIPREERS